MRSEMKARRLNAGVRRQGSSAARRPESMCGYNGATPGGNCAPSFSSRFDAAWIKPRSLPARITIDSVGRETSKVSPSSAIGDAGAAAELPRSILISFGVNDASADDPTSLPSIVASPLDKSCAESVANSPADGLKRIRGVAEPSLLTCDQTPDACGPSPCGGSGNDNMSVALWYRSDQR